MRLIDADALNKAFSRSEAIEEIYGNYGLPVIYEVIDAAPTIDAVPVVRCKDCKHFAPDRDGSNWGMCIETRSIIPKDSGCLDGEWKEDEED